MKISSLLWKPYSIQKCMSIRTRRRQQHHHRCLNPLDALIIVFSLFSWLSCQCITIIFRRAQNLIYIFNQYTTKIILNYVLKIQPIIISYILWFTFHYVISTRTNYLLERRKFIVLIQVHAKYDLDQHLTFNQVTIYSAINDQKWI